MKIRDIVQLIEEFAPLELQMSYDNSGLIVGRLDDEVHGALLAVDVTEERKVHPHTPFSTIA